LGDGKPEKDKAQARPDSNADKAAIQILHLRLHLSNVAELRCQFFPQLSVWDERLDIQTRNTCQASKFEKICGKKKLMLCIALLCLCLESMAAKTQLPRDAFHRLLWQKSIGGKAESQREMLGHLQGAESFSTWDVRNPLELSMLKYVEILEKNSMELMHSHIALFFRSAPDPHCQPLSGREAKRVLSAPKSSKGEHQFFEALEFILPMKKTRHFMIYYSCLFANSTLPPRVSILSFCPFIGNPSTVFPVFLSSSSIVHVCLARNWYQTLNELCLVQALQLLSRGNLQRKGFWKNMEKHIAAVLEIRSNWITSLPLVRSRGVFGTMRAPRITTTMRALLNHHMRCVFINVRMECLKALPN
jgi:hypothetical protein